MIPLFLLFKIVLKLLKYELICNIFNYGNPFVKGNKLISILISSIFTFSNFLSEVKKSILDKLLFNFNCFSSFIPEIITKTSYRIVSGISPIVKLFNL